jgi:hypothetical protein
MPSPQFFLEVQNGMICTLDASTSTATATELGSTEIILMDKSKSLWEYMLKKNKVDWFIEIKPLKYGGKNVIILIQITGQSILAVGHRDRMVVGFTT